MKIQDDSTRYSRVAEELRQKMRQGQLKPGDRLPSFAEMRARGVSQNTMEKVHALLERENLVVRRHRAGVFVADRNESATSRSGIIGVTGKGFSFK
jgi:GntR family transcriptional regulator